MDDKTKPGRRTASLNVRPIHFISSLPRSGSTLLSALLLQHPNMHAGIISAVGSLVAAVLKDMSQGNETSLFIDDVQRGLFDNYYRARCGGLRLEPRVDGTHRSPGRAVPGLPRHLLRAPGALDHRLARALKPLFLRDLLGHREEHQGVWHEICYVIDH